MKLSLWHKGHHIEIEGTKDEIVEFLNTLDEVSINPHTSTYSPVTYWGGYDPSQAPKVNPGGSITVSSTDGYMFVNDNVEFNT